MGLLNNMLQNGSSSYRSQAPESPQPQSAPSPQGNTFVRDALDLAKTVAAFL